MRIHIIKPGDTLYSLANKYHVTVDEIMKLNPNINANNLQIGSKIRIPSASQTGHHNQVNIVHQHVVKAGDSFWKLSKEWGVSLDELVAVNKHITNPDELKVGDIINIPKAGGQHVNDTQGGATSQVGQLIEQLIPGLSYYTVAAGDTLYKIAKANNISTDILIAFNPHLSDPNQLTVGMKIIVPTAGSLQAGTVQAQGMGTKSQMTAPLNKKAALTAPMSMQAAPTGKAQQTAKKEVIVAKPQVEQAAKPQVQKASKPTIQQAAKTVVQQAAKAVTQHATKSKVQSVGKIAPQQAEKTQALSTGKIEAQQANKMSGLSANENVKVNIGGKVASQKANTTLTQQFVGKANVAAQNAPITTKVEPLANKVAPLSENKVAPLANKVAPLSENKVAPLANKVAPLSENKVAPLANKVAPLSENKVAPLANKVAPLSENKVAPLATKVMPLAANKVAPLANKVAPLSENKVSPYANQVAPLGSNTMMQTSNQVAPLGSNTMMQSNQVAPLGSNTMMQSNQVAPLANTMMQSSDKPVAPLGSNTMMQSNQVAPIGSNTMMQSNQVAPLGSNTMMQSNQVAPLANTMMPLSENKVAPYASKVEPYASKVENYAMKVEQVAKSPYGANKPFPNQIAAQSNESFHQYQVNSPSYYSNSHQFISNTPVYAQTPTMAPYQTVHGMPNMYSQAATSNMMPNMYSQTATSNMMPNMYSQAATGNMMSNNNQYLTQQANVSQAPGFTAQSAMYPPIPAQQPVMYANNCGCGGKGQLVPLYQYANHSPNEAIVQPQQATVQKQAAKKKGGKKVMITQHDVQPVQTKREGRPWINI